MTRADASRARKVVLAGELKQTLGRLGTTDLFKGEGGKAVSRRRHAAGKKNPWTQAISEAREKLGLHGFVACKRGTPLYLLAKKLQADLVAALPDAIPTTKLTSRRRSPQCSRLEKAVVFAGKLKRTASGLRKQDLMLNKRGQVVSKARHGQGQNNSWTKP